MKQRILSFVLALCMLLPILPTAQLTATAYDETEEVAAVEATAAVSINEAETHEASLRTGVDDLPITRAH